MTNRLIRRREVETMIGLSRSTIYEMMKRGDFPKPVKVGRRAVAWPERAVHSWISDKFLETLESQ